MNAQTYFKVGLVTLVGLILLVGGYMFLRQYRMGKSRYTYGVVFKGVTRLTRGALVTVMGVPKGQIDGLDVRGDSVFVWFHLDDYPLRKGAWARVETQSLVGQYRLTLFPGDGPILQEGSIIPGTNAFGLDQVLESVGQLMQGMDTVFGKVQVALDSATLRLTEVMDSLQRGFQEIQRFVQTLEKVLVENQGSVDSTLIAIRQLALRTDSLIALIQYGDGSMQRLLREDSLYRDLRTTLQSLDTLLQDLREHPERYVKFSIF